MRLLVIEDEKKLAMSLKRGLEADGFAVDVALDGTDGLWMATEHDYDTIVLDNHVARTQRVCTVRAAS